MKDRSVTHSTFVIERHYAARPEQVFSAFADAARKRRWFVEDKGMTVEDYTLDFRVGGSERARYRFGAGSPFPGTALVSDATYQDIQPNRRIVTAYTMTLGERRISASLATFELLPEDDGTDLVFTDQGAYFEGADGPKMRQEGWTQLLGNLAEHLQR
jgi:uncharacterized protein YndB with AHSA1/START domain